MCVVVYHNNNIIKVQSVDQLYDINDPNEIVRSLKNFNALKLINKTFRYTEMNNTRILNLSVQNEKPNLIYKI